MEAASAPAAVGLKVTENVQVPAIASDVLQVFAVIENEVAFVPPTVIDVIVNADVPLFITVIVCAAV
jgi:hypothetical protein